MGFDDTEGGDHFDRGQGRVTSIEDTDGAEREVLCEHAPRALTRQPHSQSLDGVREFNGGSGEGRGSIVREVNTCRDVTVIERALL